MRLTIFVVGAVRFLICTDVAARGIDISGLPFVISILHCYLLRVEEQQSILHSVVTTLIKPMPWHTNSLLLYSFLS